MNICVFSGSSGGRRDSYRNAATALGRALAARDIGLVYGGAQVGLMGAVADAVLADGGSAIGVIPESLAAVEIAHQRLTELKIVTTMHERKADMAARSTAFIALPGGIGTLEEMFEVWTWSQLGIHAKPVGLLNVDGYYDALLAFLDHTSSEGFVKPLHREMLLTDTDPGSLIDRLLATEVPVAKKWVEP
ncbi:MAG: TIGR00730 family Rossman fold protein [Pseudomonadota bacterium]